MADITKEQLMRLSKRIADNSVSISEIVSTSSGLTAAQAADLTDGGDSSLHYHSTDRNRANHTGTQLAATISDLQTAVDHGSISGLADDDHTQYHNDTRGDARYVQKNTAITGATKTKITYDAKGLVTSGDTAALADLSDDSTHRLVTDTEKSTWNAKQDALVADTDYLTPGTAASTYATSASLADIATSGSYDDLGDKPEMLTDYVNAIDYGADPTGTSDSYSAINSALTAAGTTKILYIPAGTYLMSDTLSVGQNKSIRGAGAFKTTLKMTAAVECVEFTNYYSEISDIKLDGDSTGTIGILFTSARENYARRVQVTGFTTYGVDTYLAWSNAIIQSKIVTNGDSIRLTDDANDFLIDDCYLGGGDHGVYISGDAKCVNIDKCVIQNCNAHGVYAENGRSINIRGCYFESCNTNEDADGSAIYLKGGVTSYILASHIDGCMFSGTNEENAVYTDYAIDTVITGCHVTGNNTNKIKTTAHTQRVTVDGFYGDATHAIVDTGSQILSRIKSRAYRNTSIQADLVNDTITKVQLNAETYDLDGLFDSSTNYRFTAPVSGYYNIFGQVAFSSVVSAKRYGAYIKKNDTTYLTSSYLQSSATSIFTVQTQTKQYLVAGDYIELFAESEAGVNTVDIYYGSALTFLEISLDSVL